MRSPRTRLVTVLLVTTLLLAAGCGGKRASDATVTGATGPDAAPLPVQSGDAAPLAVAPRPDAAPLPVAEAGPRTLVLVRHEEKSATASFLPVTLDEAGGVTLAKPLPGGTLPLEYRDGAHVVVATSDGRRLAHASLAGKGHRVELAPLAGGGARTVVDLGATRPASLHLLESALLVGTTGEVLRFDTATSPPARSALVTRQGMGSKAYDHFVRSGNRLLAVDDRVRPFYADLFDVSGRGPPTRLADLELPGAINGHYAHVALAPRPDGSHAIVAIVPYSIMSGWGHVLVLLPLVEDKLVVASDRLVNSGGSELAVAEEHVRRGGGKATLVAGSELTEWRGVAVEPTAGRILVAAGSRGLFVFPLARAARPAVVDVGGECRDVLVAGGRVLALVAPGKGKGELAVYRFEGTELRPERRHRLPSDHHRFVR